jgi:hypothetical protein
VGRVVAERNLFRLTLMVGAGGREQDLSWQDFSNLGQLSRDGRQVLFSELGDGAGAGSTAYLRPVEGGTPIRLGEGLARALSPDGQKALLQRDDGGDHLEVVPVGAGGAVRLPRGPLVSFSWARFVPGAPRIVMSANEAGKGERLHVQELAGGEPRPFTAEGVSVHGDAISPDGAVIAALQGDRAVLLPLDGGAPRELPGLPARHRPVGWTEDGRSLFVRAPGFLPVELLRYDLASRKLDPWRKLTPVDPAGVLGIGGVSLSRDGEVYVYEIFRLLSDLYVIENLR